MIERTEELIDTSRGDPVHCYAWNDRSAPNCLVVLIHGLMMHGMMFDTLARHMVRAKATVIAPDLRGFGRAYFESVHRKNIDYAGSLEDVRELLTRLRKEYSSIPIILVGESLGAHLARNVASACPADISGVVLSNPCIRPRMISAGLVPHMVSQAIQLSLRERLEADMVPFVSQFLSDEPENLQNYIDDPMCRKSLDLLELIESMLVLGSFRPAKLPADMPLLIYRGSNDGVCRSASYKQFISSLHTENMDVVECQSCAHLILQSKTIQANILLALDDWLEKHRFTHSSNQLSS